MKYYCNPVNINYNTCNKENCTPCGHMRQFSSKNIAIKEKRTQKKDHRINHRIHPICLNKLCAKQKPGSSCQTTGRTRKSRQTDTRTARIAAYMHKKKISCYCKQCCPVLEQILPDPCSYLFHKLFYRMIFFGHFSAHAPQFVHFSGSIHARLFSTTIASAGQTF